MWYQVVGGGLEDRGGALFLYRSADPRTWEYAGVWAAAADHGLEGAIWECPDVFVLGGTVVVVVSVCDGRPPWAMWMTGQVSGQRFVPQASERCDGGHRYYAPQSLAMADGLRDGSYDRLDIEVSGRLGAPAGPARLTVWSCG